jgi:hypothetical protein
MLVALMDEDGFCQFASAGNVAHEARVLLEEAQTALQCLEGKDPDSSDPENDGRRIERVPGGWVVLNASKYRALATREMRRAQTRERVRKHREKGKPVTQRNATVTQGNDSVTLSEEYSEVPSVLKNSTDVAAPKKPEPDPQVKDFLDWFPEEFAKRRNGAAYFVNWPKHGALVKRLLKLHTLARLKDHAIILLTTDEEFVESTDRGIEILSAKINWFEDRLAAWEKRYGSRQAKG